MTITKSLSAYLIWYVIWSSIQTYLLYNAGYSIGMALTDGLISHFILMDFGFAVGYLLRFYQPGIKKVFHLPIWSIILAFLATSLSVWIIGQLFAEDLEYKKMLSDTFYLRLVFSVLMLSLLSLFSWLWFFSLDQQALENRNITIEKLAKETELSAIRQQLQPHFLFNSLNSISALIMHQPAKAREMIFQLSDFLRGTLRKEGQNFVLLKEEIEHLRLYMDIEKVRFGHRLNTEIDCPDILHDKKLPSLLLQPLVENAIKFGLYDTTGTTCIKITAYSITGYLILKTENPFDPDSALTKKGIGFGLSSLQRRLYLIYGRNDLLSTRKEETTFIAEVKIPQS